MNPYLTQLHFYPFEKLAQLKQGITPPIAKTAINLSIGEPAHATPAFIAETLYQHSAKYANYPTTKGIHLLRETIAEWLTRRYAITINSEQQILPVSGTREALFSFAQCVINTQVKEKPIVIMPNPFYQIYEGAALLAGAEPYYLNTTEATQNLPDFTTVPEAIWQRCQLIYVCSPANPSGAVLSRDQYQQLLQLAEQYQFVIASDECYSELYFDEQSPPVGLLQVAYELGNTDFKNCMVFHSLSKRSNAPGLRSGFVAGHAELIKSYFAYRTYHGCAMPLPTQYASISAWQDEQHVIENRRLYREKFIQAQQTLSAVCDCNIPPASFYLWLKTPISDTEFTQRLFAEENITVLAGSYLSREFNGINAGENYIRIALVASIEECANAMQGLARFWQTEL